MKISIMVMTEDNYEFETISKLAEWLDTNKKNW